MQNKGASSMKTFKKLSTSPEPNDLIRPQQKKVKKVYKSDVETLGVKLRRQLMSKYITFEKAYQVKFHSFEFSLITFQMLYRTADHPDNNGKLSIAVLTKCLMEKPFEMKNQNEALLLARYMIEDNHDHFNHLNVRQETEVTLIKSIFKNLLQNY